MPIRLHLLPAKYGDCLLIQYGAQSLTHNLLFDGGTGGTKQHILQFVNSLPEDQRHFELMMVTHVDRDHIEGMLRLLEEENLSFSASDFWFNSYKHLDDDMAEMFGAEMGEDLSSAIMRHGLPWNLAFGGKAVVIEDDANHLPHFKLNGGLEVTVLSPYRKHLKKLKPKWISEIRKAGLEPGYGLELRQDVEAFGSIALPNIERLNEGAFKEDDAEANGSSIAVLITFEEKNILLAGDAFPSTLSSSLDFLYKTGKVPIAIAKLSHHASKGNTSPELIERMECRKFAISTNGSIYRHPSHETMARIIKRAPNSQIFFNYNVEHNKVWGERKLKERYNYNAFYPTAGAEGIYIDV